MESASFYTQLASQEVTAIFESLSAYGKPLLNEVVGTNCGELAELLIGLHANLCDTDEGTALLAVKGAMKVCEKLAASYPRYPLDLLRYLPIRLSGTVTHGEVHEAAMVALDFHRKLADIQPDVLGFTLAETLYSLSGWLHGEGKGEEALAIVKETTELCEDLIQEHPGLAPNLGTTSLVNTIMAHLEGIGENPHGVIFAQQSVNILRKVAQESSSTYRPALARSLRILSSHLYKSGHNEDMIATSREAANIYRDLPGQSVNALRMELVATLRGLTTELIETGRKEEELAPHELFISILRDDNPFGSDLLASLPKLSESLSAVGEQDKALAIAMEAVKICRELKKRNVLGTNLASSTIQVLHGLFEHFTAANKWYEALRAIGGAVCLDVEPFRLSLRRTLYRLFRDYDHCGHRWKEAFNFEEGMGGEILRIYRLELDQAVRNVSNYYMTVTGQWNSALLVIQEAAIRDPATFGSKLDQVVCGAFAYYKAKGRWDKALDIMREAESRNADIYSVEREVREAVRSYKSEGRVGDAIVVMREAAKRNPDKYKAELDQAVRDAFDYYKAKGSWNNALDVMEEAATREPERYNAELDQAISNAFNCYKAIGSWSRALDIMEEAEGRNADKYNVEREVREAFRSYKHEGKLVDALDVMWEAARRKPDTFSSELDQASRDAFNHCKAEGWWTSALKVIREAAGRNPDEFGSEFDQALRDAFDHYKAKGWCVEALNVMEEAANRNPDKYNAELEQAVCDAFDYYKTSKDCSRYCRWDEAARIMRKAASRNPEKYNSRLDQAERVAIDYYKHEGRLDKALEVMRDAVIRNPGKYEGEFKQMADGMISYHARESRPDKIYAVIQMRNQALRGGVS